LGCEKDPFHKRGAETEVNVNMKSYIIKNKRTGAKSLIVNVPVWVGRPPIEDNEADAVLVGLWAYNTFV
jgi:hypothetical protein